ncbi:hypothetical protein K435DRAFT_856609 [Dendrothele bispora CBS 962.96]|uniref:Uncharacterized protein n=1 Tax=Dendrothele bispora (strain CBS 962.96) TaxID=1314807 RepID=A0A4S8M820_DENBC|nr:hypothetical protein K435DRAFT_856609 [Dendrothele bispora CBS 962.96]
MANTPTSQRAIEVSSTARTPDNTSKHESDDSTDQSPEVRAPRLECIQSDIRCTCQVRLPFWWAEDYPRDDMIILHNGNVRNLPVGIPRHPSADPKNKFDGPRKIAPASSDNSDIESNERVIEHFECNIDEDIYYLKAVMMWYRNGELGEHLNELKELDVRIFEVERWLMFMGDGLGARVKTMLQSNYISDSE